MSVDADRYLDCLDADARRMRDVAARDLTAAVPSCPGWDVTELVRHTAQVYLHKTECMRHGAPEGPWPPAGTQDREPLALFDEAYASLRKEFAEREPGDATPTWYEPEQTVGFWIRRMAQETVIHRLDAELALGEETAPIPADLAVDGIDEVLVRFLAYATTGWAAEFGDTLAACDGRSVRVRAGNDTWDVRLTSDGVVVTRDGSDEVSANVSGAANAVLLWLWRRTDDDTVTIEGDAALVAKMRELLGTATL